MNTADSSERIEPAFHAGDLEQIASYRTVSGLAIVSLLLGLAAPLCFAAPVFMAIPLFGTALALVALRRIVVSDGALTGRWAASIGLALCLIAGMAAFSQSQTTRFLCSRQAQQLGRQWIELLSAGEIEKAFRLTTAGTRPELPASPDEPSPKQTPFEAFANDPVVKALSSAGAGSVVRLVETVAFEPRTHRQAIVQQRFTVAPTTTTGVDAPASVQSVDAVLTLQRSYVAGESQLRWLVAGYQDPAKAVSGLIAH